MALCVLFIGWVVISIFSLANGARGGVTDASVAVLGIYSPSAGEWDVAIQSCLVEERDSYKRQA